MTNSNVVFAFSSIANQTAKASPQARYIRASVQVTELMMKARRLGLHETARSLNVADRALGDAAEASRNGDSRKAVAHLARAYRTIEDACPMLAKPDFADLHPAVSF